MYQPPNERKAAETSSTAENAYMVWARGSTDSPSEYWTIEAARGRAGSNQKIGPSIGFGAKPMKPVTIASMIASPSARAVASTAAATIAGRAARTVTVQRARQRLTPSETAPSLHELGTARRASTTIAI